MSKYYYHGIKCSIDPVENINRLICILFSGGLKSKRLLGIKNDAGYNGLDYISVCSKENILEYSKYPNNAFFTFIHNKYCFIISDDIETIKPKYIDISLFSHYKEFIDYMDEYPEERFSDMFDEYQVKDEIPLDKIIGIGLPLFELEEYSKTNEKCKNYLDRLKMIANSYNLDIVDTSGFFFVESYEEQKEKEENFTLKNLK